MAERQQGGGRAAVGSGAAAQFRSRAQGVVAEDLPNSGETVAVAT